MDNPWDLDYWKTEDWKTVQGRLNDVQPNRISPSMDHFGDSLRMVSPTSCNVVVVGQDPYPDSGYATGHAFSIPRRYSATVFPRSLKIIFTELVSDIGCPFPAHGDLSGWVEQGVLLINAIPTCEHGRSKSHDWREYYALTREILQRAAENRAVFCFLGAVARGYADVVGRDNPNNPVIETNHPATRFPARTGNPFSGSRIFSRINEKLVGLAKEPIDWRIYGDPQRTVSNRQQGDTLLSKGRLLDNITGADLGPLYDCNGKVIPRS